MLTLFNTKPDPRAQFLTTVQRNLELFEARKQSEGMTEALKEYINKKKFEIEQQLSKLDF